MQARGIEIHDEVVEHDCAKTEQGKVGSFATKLGLIIGAYHYAAPGGLLGGDMTVAANRKADAKAQAALAVRAADGVPQGDLPLTLDFEEKPCGWTFKQTAVWTRDFLLEAERLSGRKPMIYANGYFLNELVKVTVPGITWTDYKLWVAMWGPKYGKTPKAVPIWNTDWTFLFLGVILFIAVMVNNAISKRAQGATRRK